MTYPVATTLLNGGFSRVVPIVSSFFDVRDVQLSTRENYALFLIANAEIKDSFPKFLKELGKIDMTATAKRSKYYVRLMPTLSTTIRLPVKDDNIVLTVSHLPKHASKGKKHLPFAFMFFIVTVAVVFIDGYDRSGSLFADHYVSDPILMGAIYTLSLMGILGIHELGHMVALKHYKIKASWPYFIPGIVGFIPTLGALITQRSNVSNRNVMFDVGISGPIAGLAIAIIVSIYGGMTSVLIPVDEYQRLSEENRLFPFSPSLLMLSTLYVTDKVVEDMVVVMSPILFAAWIGFALTSVNLVPAWQLDGGHLSRAALGERWHRIVTYGGVGALIMMSFWFMAILVLALSRRFPGSPPLDDVTPLSRKRKALFILALGIAALTAPIPSSIVPFV
jgi:Zn-dependent protease